MLAKSPFKKLPNFQDETKMFIFIKTIFEYSTKIMSNLIQDDIIWVSE